MINSNKVKLMASLALYEDKNEEDLKISKYYKTDYVRYYMIRTILNVSFAYVCILLLLAMYHIEELVAKAVVLNYSLLGFKILMGYVVLVIVFSVAAFFIYTEQYNTSKKRLTKYYKKLRILNKMYKEEEKPGM